MKKRNYSFKTLFTIPVDLKRTLFSLERVNFTKKNLFELKTFHFNKKTASLYNSKVSFKCLNNNNNIDNHKKVLK